MVKTPTHKLYIFLMVIIRCIVLQVSQVLCGSSPPLSEYNLEITLKMVKIPTHKLYIFLKVMIRYIVFNGHFCKSRKTLYAALGWGPNVKQLSRTFNKNRDFSSF